jgi:hypothetical protein
MLFPIHLPYHPLLCRLHYFFGLTDVGQDVMDIDRVCVFGFGDVYETREDVR